MHSQIAAAKVLAKIRNGQSLSAALPTIQATQPAEYRPAIQALSYGVLRYFEQIEFCLRQLVAKPLKPKDRIVEDLLRVGLFELLEAQKPDHAIVNNLVRAVKKQRAWASGLVNGSLRRFIREKANWQTLIDNDEQARYLLPTWLLHQLRKDYPQQWENIAQNLAKPAPMVVRVNTAKASLEEIQARLQKEGMASQPVPGVESALCLQRPMEATQLPGFADGLVSVQDSAAQLAAGLLAAQPGQRVLDACAAPGGKTVHMLERADGNLQMTAVEIDAQRVERLGENLKRSGYDSQIKIADAGDLDSWWDGRPFDRILLDAPCSATGVIRRHPDIKRHRQADDIRALTVLQSDLLARLWTVLRPGGTLLYATCSVLSAENDVQIQQFLDRHDDASALPIEAQWGHERAHGRQILPGELEMDGFFYALLRKSE